MLWFLILYKYIKDGGNTLNDVRSSTGSHQRFIYLTMTFGIVLFAYTRKCIEVIEISFSCSLTGNRGKA